MAMWCPNCKTKSPALAVGHDELICATCSTEVVAQPPKTKSLRKRISTAASAIKVAPDQPATPNDTNYGNQADIQTSHAAPTRRSAPDKKSQGPLPEVAFIERLPKQTRPAARPVPARPKPTQTSATATTTKPKAKRKWRTDNAHLTNSDSAGHHIDPKQIQKTNPPSAQPEPTPAPTPTPTTSKASIYFAIQIGLLLFLMGHGLTTWAFLAGNFGAWSAGSFCSIGGITIAIVSIVHALRQIDERK